MPEDNTLNHRDILNVHARRIEGTWTAFVSGPRDLKGVGAGATFEEAVARAVVQYSDAWDEDFRTRQGKA